MDNPMPRQEFTGHALRLKTFIDHLKKIEEEKGGEGTNPYILLLEKIPYQEIKGGIYISTGHPSTRPSSNVPSLTGPPLTFIPLDLVKATSESSEIREVLEKTPLFLVPEPRKKDKGKGKSEEPAEGANKHDHGPLDQSHHSQGTFDSDPGPSHTKASPGGL